MTARAVALVVLASVLYALLGADVTLPALTVLGLVL